MFIKNVSTVMAATGIVLGSLWLLDASLTTPMVVNEEEATRVAATSLAPAEEVTPEAWLRLKLSETQAQEEYTLAIALYFEARGETVRGQQKVAEVIFRRVLDPRWPDSVEAVIKDGEERLHRCQFSFMCDGRPEEPVDQDAWVLAHLTASSIYESFLRGELEVGCAHSYHADYATNTAYFERLERVDQVGQHIFYCDREV